MEPFQGMLSRGLPAVLKYFNFNLFFLDNQHDNLKDKEHVGKRLSRWVILICEYCACGE